MVQAILKGGKAAQELVRLILDRAAGNPLFMEEFTRTLLERGYIERKNGCYELTEGDTRFKHGYSVFAIDVGKLQTP
jgi:predicted ATPase